MLLQCDPDTWLQDSALVGRDFAKFARLVRQVSVKPSEAFLQDTLDIVLKFLLYSFF